jgi:hypothetical protein
MKTGRGFFFWSQIHSNSPSMHGNTSLAVLITERQSIRVRLCSGTALPMSIGGVSGLTLCAPAQRCHGNLPAPEDAASFARSRHSFNIEMSDGERAYKPGAASVANC